MADTVTNGFETVLGAIADLLKTGASPDVLEAQRLLLRRLALEGDVLPSRVPAPRNITEVGGYINLLTTLGETATRDQMLAAALGVAGPTPGSILGELPPPVGFGILPNDRPAGAAQPSIPTEIVVRADFARTLKPALAAIRADGCGLPLLAPQPVLPRADEPAPQGDALLGLLGRRLDLVPGTLLANPDTDALAVGRRASDPPDAVRLVARESDGGTKVAEDQWVVLTCSASACQLQPAAPRRLRPVEPDLAAAGWYPGSPATLPSKLRALGSFASLRNLTGLIAAVTTLGSELALLYPPQLLAASSLADRRTWIWNGTDFVAP
ncbi:MAG TPA: hypothetical protein VLB76_18755 [Thermoanaerobaculia bacterium]|jgi:hypothetical protein|nr:hypothetical protein [Thermoanaerobaculia bacterium]